MRSQGKAFSFFTKVWEAVELQEEGSIFQYGTETFARDIYLNQQQASERERKRAFFEAFLTYPRVSRYIICFSLRRLSSLEFGHSYMKSEIVEFFFGE